jgi:iron(III) transport system substrate-binding protein
VSLAGPVSADAFDDLVAGAKKEGKLSIAVSTPNEDATHRALLEAFDKRFGLHTEWSWVVQHPSQTLARVLAEKNAGRVTVDVFDVGPMEYVAELAKNQLVKPYPWVEVFGSRLPSIKEPVERLTPGLRGMALGYFDGLYGVAWNTDFVKKDDVPKRLEDFTDPKWKGQFALSGIANALPLPIYSLVLGDQQTIDLAKRLFSNRPIFANGSPMTSSVISTGEAHLGFISLYLTDREKMKGAPQAFRFFDDYIVDLALNVTVLEGSPHPNTARLFVAWLVTEGMRINEEKEAMGRYSDPASKMHQEVDEAMKNGAKIVEEKSFDDIKQVDGVGHTITQLITTQGP